MNLQNYSNYYFIGIGGIGMSALARYFKQKGYRVGGYDRTPSPLTTDLESEGISIIYEDVAEIIPNSFFQNKSTLVVYTPAIPHDCVQLNYFQQHNFTIMKRSELLNQVTLQGKSLCIAGTHGKTTTSTIAAHLLYQSHISCNAFLGGISENYKTNLLVSKESNLMVVEADEYDRSFLHLSPFMAVVTSIDPDHLDIYGSGEEFKQGFQDFANLVQAGGVLILKKGIDLTINPQKKVKLFTYSLNEEADFYAKNIVLKNGEIHFDFVTPTNTIHDLRMTIPVMINVENSVAAMALAWLNGVTPEEIRMGIASYSGIYRRFNIVYKSKSVTYIDDYAHHPSELRASINSIRQMNEGKKITGIFQPHLYTRTRDFADDFAAVLSQLDRVILLEIYPAREEAIAGVNSQMLLDKITIADKILLKNDELIPYLKNLNCETLVTFGAGDIDRFVPQIKQMLQNAICK
jgi:UDP-N-acetylmuramate--alanine ligase